MIGVEVRYEMSRLNRALQEYARLSGKTELEALAKQSGKLGWNIYQGLRALAPAKGAVRAERLAALKAGYGVKVRPAVLQDVMTKYHVSGDIHDASWKLLRRGKLVGSFERKGKRMNIEALAVERELNLRESGRGFTGYSAPRPGSRNFAQMAKYDRSIESRYGFVLSMFNIDAGIEHKRATLTWLGKQHGGYTDAVTGLSKERQQAVLARAIQETREDIQVYLDRKLRENAAQARLQ